MQQETRVCRKMAKGMLKFTARSRNENSARKRVTIIKIKINERAGQKRAHGSHKGLGVRCGSLNFTGGRVETV